MKQAQIELQNIKNRKKKDCRRNLYKLRFHYLLFFKCKTAQSLSTLPFLFPSYLFIKPVIACVLIRILTCFHPPILVDFSKLTL